MYGTGTVPPYFTTFYILNCYIKQKDFMGYVSLSVVLTILSLNFFKLGFQNSFVKTFPTKIQQKLDFFVLAKITRNRTKCSLRTNANMGLLNLLSHQPFF